MNGAECDLCNYHPISVLPVLSRVNTLCTFLCDNNLIFSRQSSFRKNLRTETALIRIIDDLFNLDKDRVSGVVLIDYCKAFYIVDHELLLKKLEAYGIVNTELKWCRSYLNGRKQLVHLSGKESSKAPMKHGIPQGSILGPLFFILQRSTSACQFTSRPLCWWLLELKLSLNISANEICHWADSNKLRINKSKAKVLTITRKCLASNINDELVVHSNLLSQHANCVRFLHAIARLTVRSVQFTRNQAITIH